MFEDRVRLLIILMKGLLVHSLVVSPVIRWITSPARRWSARTGLNIAIFALIAIAVLQLKRMELNCFDLLEVDSTASNSEIAKSYRRLSVKYHPDTVGRDTSIPFGFSSPEALFIDLRKCSDTLSDSGKRSYYSRFGDLDVNFRNEETMFRAMAVFSFLGYLINYVVCMVLTASRESKAGRWWITCFVVFAFTSEMLLKYFGNGDLFAWIPYIGSRLVFEQVQILKELIPSVLSSAILLSQLTYKNDEIDTVNHVLRTVRDSNIEIAKFISDPSTVMPVPAGLKLFIPGATPQAAAATGTTTKNPTGQASPSFFSMARIMQILFWAYFAKMCYNAIRGS